MPEKKEELVAKAEKALHAAKYDEALELMKKVIKDREGVTKFDIMLLFKSHKAVLGLGRAQIQSIQMTTQRSHDQILRTRLADVYKKLKLQLRDESFYMVEFLNKKLLKYVPDLEIQVWGKEIIGNCYWYLLTISDSCDRPSYATYALDAYREGYDFAQNLPPTNVLRLSLILHYSQYMEENTQFIEFAESIVRDNYSKAVAAEDSIIPEQKEAILAILEQMKESISYCNSRRLHIVNSLKISMK